MRNRRSLCSQMGHEAMLFLQSLRVTHRPMVALHEDAASVGGNNTGCGEGSWTHGRNPQGSAGAWKVREHREHFVQRQWRPVGIDQRSVHSMHSCLRTHSKLNSSFLTFPYQSENIVS